jgi:putative FmdB family regulatory protein
MPIYEYACTSCGERTEAKQSFTDPPLEECPVCGGRLRRLYSPVGIVFKGSGFYSTDARKPQPSDGKGQDATRAKDAKDAKDAASKAGSSAGDKGKSSSSPGSDAKATSSSTSRERSA